MQPVELPKTREQLEKCDDRVIWRIYLELYVKEIDG